MADFSVVIPSRNADNVDACVDALRAAGETCRVFVIDDGIERFRLDCQYVQGVKPFIFSRAVNQGIVAASSDDVILCGDDTRLLTWGGFTGASKRYLRYRKYVVGSVPGIVSASITAAVGNLHQLAGQGTGIFKEYRMLCFIAVLIPREVIQEIGLMDERYVDYGCDDGAYCYEARKVGMGLWVDRDVVVEHGVLPSEFRGSASRDFSQNAKLFEKKFGVSYQEACG